MSRTILFELLVAAGCAWSGAKLWSGEAQRPRLEPAAARRSGERPAGETAAPVDAEAHAGRSVAEDAAVAGDPRAGEESVATSVDSGADAGSQQPPPLSPSRRSARAAISAIAPLPPLAGLPPPRIPEVLAFAALRMVGKDAAAEELWNEAINDPNHSDETRSDLIEDLNDEGYPDPDHLTIADLPLISARLAIIERLAPHAADEVNAAAFEEAYKDLLGMWLGLKRAEAR